MIYKYKKYKFSLFYFLYGYYFKTFDSDVFKNELNNGPLFIIKKIIYPNVQ